MKRMLELILVIYLPLLVILLFILFPIYWTLTMSFKSDHEILSRLITYLPTNFTFRNYIAAWVEIGFANFFKNSLIASLSGATIVVTISIFVGYALARFKFKGKGVFMMMLLCTQFFPGPMLLVPLFNIYKSLGLLNTIFSLVITYATFQMAFNAILMRGFVSSIPLALEEAARIDGCNSIQTIVHVLLPLLTPAIVAGFSFSFVNCWKDFLFAFMFNNDSIKHTISVGLYYMLSEFTMDYGYMAAGGIIALIPPMLIFIYIQRFLVQGLSSGAVKG